MKILAFGHRKRVGKDTCCKLVKAILAEKQPGLVVKIAGFADKVKDIGHQLFAWAGLKDKEYYDNHSTARETPLELINLTPREIWIGIGNGIRAAVNYDATWMDYLLEVTKDCDVLLINDLRFLGELNGVRKRGGLIYRVDRDSETKVIDGADDVLAAYNMWDGVINNNGTMSQLYDQLVPVVERHLL